MPGHWGTLLAKPKTAAKRFGANAIDQSWPDSRATALSAGVIDDRLIALDYGYNSVADSIAIIQGAISRGFRPLPCLNTDDNMPLASVDVAGFVAWATAIINGVGPAAVGAWEVVNEPDLKGPDNNANAEPYGRLFGALADAAPATARLLFAYQGDHQDAALNWSQVVSGGGFFPLALAQLTTAQKARIGGLTIHPYGPLNVGGDAPYSGWQMVPRARQVATSLGVFAPFWITEVGMSLATDVPVGVRATSEADQAATIARYVADAKAWAYVEALYIFRYQDTLQGDLYGLLRADQTAKPSWTAFLTGR